MRNHCKNRGKAGKEIISPHSLIDQQNPVLYRGIIELLKIYVHALLIHFVIQLVRQLYLLLRRLFLSFSQENPFSFQRFSAPSTNQNLFPCKSKPIFPDSVPGYPFCLQAGGILLFLDLPQSRLNRVFHSTLTLFPRSMHLKFYNNRISTAII